MRMGNVVIKSRFLKPCHQVYALNKHILRKLHMFSMLNSMNLTQSQLLNKHVIRYKSLNGVMVCHFVYIFVLILN